MTNETDSTRRRPPTIELKATEVAPEKSAAAEPGSDAAGAGIRAEASAAQPSGGASARTLVATALAGIAGGVIGAAMIGTGLWFAGYGPDRAAPPVPNYDGAVADISARLKKLESAGQSQPAPAQPQPDPALASRLTGAEAATKSLSDQLAALNRHLDDVAGAAQNALTQAKSAASAATAAADVAKNATQNASQASAARGDLDALAARMTALEGAIKKLTDETRQTASAELDGRALRLALASAALRTAVERGVSRPRAQRAHTGVATGSGANVEQRDLPGPAGKERPASSSHHAGRGAGRRRSGDGRDAHRRRRLPRRSHGCARRHC